LLLSTDGASDRSLHGEGTIGARTNLMM